eukprot:5768634-Ditylum_brightwellii.AAC.1
MDLYQDGLPHHLPKLSEIKEMLIAYVCPVMKTYRLKGGTIGYKGNVLSIEQDIGGLQSPTSSGTTVAYLSPCKQPP